MRALDADIRRLYGVGEVRASRYEAMGIKTVGDLLLHYPRGYENRGDIRLISESDGASKNAYLLTVATEPKSVRVKGRMTLTKFRAYDDSAVCDITFFNQEYLKSVFVPASTFRFYGRIEKKSGRYVMTSPAYEPCDDASELRDLIPVYPLTEGISAKQIFKDIRSAILIASTADDTEEPLPEEVRRRNSLCLRSYALRNIHSPDDFTALAAAKKRLIFDEFFYFALGLALSGARSKRLPAFACKEGALEPLLKNLPYELTGAQQRVIEEIRADMAKDTQMCRMLVGDVGSGKTVCAAAAILFAVQSGRQAALMAPTEILALQHYESLGEMFSRMGISCALLIGATPAAQKRKIYSGLKKDGEGRIDVVIGTHALLSEAVDFNSLGLAVVDEQHRFGVEQRSSLSRKNPMAHTLVMSATPIPRSLALVLYGNLDLSFIDEVPLGRQRVDTYVVDESYRQRLNGFIRKQTQDGGQVYVVCPSVEESEVSEEEQTDLLMESVGVGGNLLDSVSKGKSRHSLKSAVKFSAELAETFPDLTVDFLHGRLSSKEKEAKMRAFVSGKTDVLVSTTVIEVGVNVPRASLMIVENAERFGLSQLHQLRGRVGRGTRKSYCVLVSDSINEEGAAKDRLLTLKNSYNGYEIAEKDLEMRGPGDFLRTGEQGSVRQSGGVRFRLAELCDDTGLMSLAFKEAKELINADAQLIGYPALRREVERMFEADPITVN